jgi:hypothetical protein
MKDEPNHALDVLLTFGLILHPSFVILSSGGRRLNPLVRKKRWLSDHGFQLALAVPRGFCGHQRSRSGRRDWTALATGAGNRSHD